MWWCIMKTKVLLAIPLWFLFFWGAQASELRIASTAGVISETVCALGHESSLVGVDITSTYPKSLSKLPKLGYARNINAEGILSLKPNLVLLGERSRTETLVEQLESAKIRVVFIPSPSKVEDAVVVIQKVAEAIGEADKGEALAKRVEVELAEVREKVAQSSIKPKAIFIYARGMKALFASGTGTSADEMMSASGAKNAVNGYASYQPLSAETVMAGNPDVLIAFGSGVESVGGEDGFWKLPGLRHCEAGKNRHLVQLEDGALSFGPRVAHFIAKVHREIFAGLPSKS